ncbi:uncharacterized protein O3C94_009434 [Discoglossus pictus]
MKYDIEGIQDSSNKWLFLINKTLKAKSPQKAILHYKATFTMNFYESFKMATIKIKGRNLYLTCQSGKLELKETKENEFEKNVPKTHLFQVHEASPDYYRFSPATNSEVCMSTSRVDDKVTVQKKSDQTYIMEFKIPKLKPTSLK